MGIQGIDHLAGSLYVERVGRLGVAARDRRRGGDAEVGIDVAVLNGFDAGLEEKVWLVVAILLWEKEKHVQQQYR